MKIRAIFGTLSAIFVLSFIACDDNLNSVGSGMRPDSDSIFLGVDTVQLTAKTLSLNNSVFARTTATVLGEYKDDIFGSIKSDYLCEFYSPEKIGFKEKAFEISEVSFKLYTIDFMGDKNKLVGVSAYGLNKSLKKDFNTDIDPKDYTDLSIPIANGSYVFDELPYPAGGASLVFQQRLITLFSDTILGRKFLDEWRTSPSTFKDNEKFKKFFPGLYITTTYGDGNIVTIGSTELDITYKYWGRNLDNTKDSIYNSVYTISVTPEVAQLSHIDNDVPPQLLLPDSEKTYLKTPAGLYTQITIPLKDIIKYTGRDKTVNSCSFALTGFTEKEDGWDYRRPDNLLFINKDSIDGFFEDRKLVDNKTSYLLGLYGANYYNVRTQGYNSRTGDTQFTNNIFRLVDHYREKYKDTPIENIPDLEYIVLPVDVTFELVNESTIVATKIYNKMSPSSAILRTDEKNMKMGLVYSKYIIP